MWLTAHRIRVHGALLAASLWTLYAISVSTAGVIDRSGVLKGADFLQFYVAGRLAAESEQLYDAASFGRRARALVPAAEHTHYLPLYGPQVALLFAPLAALPYGWALAVWTLLSAALYAACAVVLWRRCPALQRDGPSIALLAFAQPALFAVIGYGQLGTLALAAFTAAYVCLEREREFAAGLAIGLLAYKPQLGLAAALVFAGSGRWRVVAGALVGGGAPLAVAAVVLGPGVLADYASVVAGLRELAPTLAHKLHQMHSLRSFFAALLPDPAALAAYALTAAAAAGVALRGWTRDAPLVLRFALLLVVTALVNPHQYLYDLVILTPVWLLVADWSLAHPRHPQAMTLRLCVYLGFLLPALGPLSRWTHLQLSIPALALMAWALWRAIEHPAAEVSSDDAMG